MRPYRPREAWRVYYGDFNPGGARQPVIEEQPRERTPEEQEDYEIRQMVEYHLGVYIAPGQGRAWLEEQREKT
jgi:hypothetical protein